MTVQEELADKKLLRTSFQKTLAGAKSRLDNLYAEKESLTEKIKTLETRTSVLAKELLKDSRKELERLEDSIAEVQGRVNRFKQDLDDVERKILEMEEHTTLYIQEQVKRMVPEVLNYIQRRSKEIGLDIKRTFQIKDGEAGSKTIGVFDGKIKVTETKDFYFTGDTHIRTGAGLCVKFEKTQWYNNYCNDFQEAFNKKLKESWTYNDTFNLTINGTTFTLELV